MKVVTAQEMRMLEAGAAATGLSYEEMMERAGGAVARAIAAAHTVPGARVLVLVGPGNNGGDGLVTARLLREQGAEVSAYIWKRETEADENYRRAVAAGVTVLRIGDDVDMGHLVALVDSCDILVDALLGTGVAGPLREDVAGLLATVKERLALRLPSTPDLMPLDRTVPRRDGCPLVVAVDLPSGLNADTGEADALTLGADLTVTFAFPKQGLLRFPGAELAGRLVVADIGIAPALAADVTLEVAEPAMIGPLLPERPLQANKGTFGKVMVVGGSIPYAGAPYMAAMGAARVGAGLVTLAVPQPIYPSLAARATEMTFLILPSDMGALTPAAIKLLGEAFAGYRALLLGPGLGREPATFEFVRQLLGLRPAGLRSGMGFLARETVAEARSHELPAAVIDADALNALAATPEWWKGTQARLVLTPHPGELARLRESTVDAIQADRVEAARAAAATWGQIVVLKGAHTVVAAPDGRATLMPFANPALASAGTGDVLAGTIAGLLAQGLAPERAAVVGCYVHGYAGELAAEDLGQAGVLATDLLPRLPQAMHKLRGI